MTQPNNYCSDEIWQIPTDPPTLVEDRIHLWRARLDLTTVEIARLATVLSADEVARANRFRFDRHRRRFIVARGILRHLLGNYLNTEPKDLKFSYSDRGKPQLKDSDSSINIQFNLSHSQEYALYGFTARHLIGVDLEYLREMPDLIKIARRFFSEPEYELLSQANQVTRLKLFFQLWTAKEAYLKAIGTGLAGSLASVDIDIEDLGSSIDLTLKSNISDRWSLYSCTPTTGYVAALAVQTKPLASIDFWHWQQN